MAQAWQNLRSTREKEPVELHGIKSAGEQIGNSEAVAWKHHLQTTESNFLSAIRTDVGSDVTVVSESLDAARTEPKLAPKILEKPLELQREVTILYVTPKYPSGTRKYCEFP